MKRWISLALVFCMLFGSCVGPGAAAEEFFADASDDFAWDESSFEDFDADFEEMDAGFEEAPGFEFEAEEEPQDFEAGIEDELFEAVEPELFEEVLSDEPSAETEEAQAEEEPIEPADEAQAEEELIEPADEAQAASEAEEAPEAFEAPFDEEEDLGEFAPETQSLILPQVQDVQVRLLSESSVEVTWSQPELGADADPAGLGYVLRYGTSDVDLTEDVTIPDFDVQSHTLTGLTPGQTYSFALVLYCDTEADGRCYGELESEPATLTLASEAPEEATSETTEPAEAGEEAEAETEPYEAPEEGEEEEIPAEAEAEVKTDAPLLGAPALLLNGLKRAPLMMLRSVSLPKVSNVQAKRQSESSIEVTWSKPSLSTSIDPTKCGYEVKYGSSASDLSDFVTISDINTKTHTVTGLTLGREYFFEVRLYYEDGSGKSYGLPGTASAMVTPDGPASLTVVSNSTTEAKLTWTRVSTASGYVIERSADGLSFAQIATISANTTLTYIDKNLNPGTEYTYRVYSYKGSTACKSAEYPQKTFLCLPMTPQNVKATTDTVNAIKITWDQAKGVSGYRVHRSNNDGSTFEPIYTCTSATETSYVDTGRITGKEYLYYVESFYNGEDSVAYSEPSVIAVGAAKMAAPTGLKTLPVDTQSIKISWNRDSEVNGYILEGSDHSDSGWAQIYKGANNSYTETGLTVGKVRYYRVKSYISVGGGEVESLTTSGKVFDTPRPAVPDHLQLTHQAHDKVKVSFGAVPGATGYQVERSTDKTNWTVAYANSTNSCVMDGLDAGTQYYVRVAAYVNVNVNGATSRKLGNYTAVKSIVAQSVKPANFGYKSLTRNTQISLVLDWDAVPDAAGYYVWQRESPSGQWVWQGETAKGVLQYTFKGIELETAYDYRVCAYYVKDDGYTRVNGELSQFSYTVPMRAPSGLTKTNVSMTQFKISWDVLATISGYEVEVTTPEDPGFLYKKDVGTATSLSVSGLTCGYRYVVKVTPYCVRDGKTIKHANMYATNNTSDPNYNAGYVKTKGYYMTTPDNVRNLRVVAATAAKSVKLSWDKVPGADGYAVKRATTAKGTYSKIKQLSSAEITSYTDVFVAADVGKTYFYKVYAFVGGVGGNTWSESSAYVSGVVAPGETAAVYLSNNSATRMQIEWKAIAGAHGYDILRSTSYSGTYTKVASVPAPTLKYVDGDLKTGTTYYYKVVGYIKNGGVYTYGIASTPVSKKAQPCRPRNSNAWVRSGKTVLVGWTAVGEATSFVVYGSTSLNGTYQKMGTFKGGTTSGTVSGLTPGQTYYFKVKSVVGGVESDFSGVSSGVKVMPQKATTINYANIAGSTTSLKISWSAVQDADGYELQYRIHNGGAATPAWTVVNGSIGASTRNYTVSNLKLGEYYQFRVRGYNNVGGSKLYGGWSSWLKGYTKALAPTSMSSYAKGTYYIRTQWTQGTGATGFRLYYRKKGTSAWLLAKDVKTSQKSQKETISSLSSGTTYQIMVVSRYVDTKGVTQSGNNTMIEVTTR